MKEFLKWKPFKSRELFPHGKSPAPQGNKGRKK